MAPAEITGQLLRAVEDSQQGGYVANVYQLFLAADDLAVVDETLPGRLADVVRQVVSQVLEHGLPEGTCLNVNIPRKSEEKLKGIKVCRQAMARYEEEFEERRDPMGIPYFWLTGVFRIQDHGEDTDEWALKNHYVSVVPVQFDMTSHHSISTLNQWDFE